MSEIEKEAIAWWENLINAERAQFPEPKDINDIVGYYTNPADYICLEYGML